MTLATIPRYDPERVRETGGSAVVVGCSVAGLLAARVLADRFAAVTVIDRDRLADEPESRSGVPQSSQPHGLLEGGRATIEDLLPGYCATLVDAGGVAVDTGSDVEFYDDGIELAQSGVERTMYCATRPLLELTIRRHVAAVEGVELRGNCTFLDYRYDDHRAVVEGVRIQNESGTTTTLDADLVVDATGRTSRTPGWLAEHGYQKPPLDEVHVDLRYGTVQIERPPGDRRTVFLPASHPYHRGALVVPVEGGRWLVNLHGFHGEHPPGDVDGFRQFAEGLATPAVAELLDEARVTSETVDRYPIPSSRRYRYEDLERFPAGLLVVGDAIASFNPIYAQGMTVAAFEALVLHHTLAEGEDALAARFFEAATSVIDIAWSMGVGPDFAFPEPKGRGPAGAASPGGTSGDCSDEPDETPSSRKHSRRSFSSNDHRPRYSVHVYCGACSRPSLGGSTVRRPNPTRLTFPALRARTKESIAIAPLTAPSIQHRHSIDFWGFQQVQRFRIRSDDFAVYSPYSRRNGRFRCVSGYFAVKSTVSPCIR